MTLKKRNINLTLRNNGVSLKTEMPFSDGEERLLEDAEEARADLVQEKGIVLLVFLMTSMSIATSSVALLQREMKDLQSFSMVSQR
ncbi:hypothetical protein D3C81_2156170 [compost metagenome]